MASLLARLASPFRKRLEVFMSDAEIRALEAAFDQLQEPVRVLEWGSGGSTLHFGSRLHRGSSWLAIEHQRDWAERVREHLQKGTHEPAIRVHHVATNGTHVEGSGDGVEHVFRDYISYPGSRGPYDVVLVDGRARVACLEAGWHQLSTRGFAALHDAQRAEYQRVVLEGAYRVTLRDSRKQVDGGDIELRFFFKEPDRAQALAAALTNLDRAVVVTTA